MCSTSKTQDCTEFCINVFDFFLRWKRLNKLIDDDYKAVLNVVLLKIEPKSSSKILNPNI